MPRRAPSLLKPELYTLFVSLSSPETLEPSDCFEEPGITRLVLTSSSEGSCTERTSILLTEEGCCQAPQGTLLFASILRVAIDAAYPLCIMSTDTLVPIR